MRKVSLLALLTLAFISSCSDETTVYQTSEQELYLENSEAVKLNSIVYDNAGVIDVMQNNQLSGKSSKSVPDDSAGDYPITLVAQVYPPSYVGGSYLTASHVYLEGDFVYVAYNTVGVDFAGAIDIINVSNPNIPIVTSRLYYPNADINSIKYENGFVYAVGGLDVKQYVAATSNSFIVKIPAINGIIDLGSEMVYGYQPGFVATDLVIADKSVYVTSGMDGTLTEYDKNTLEFEDEVSFPDLRSVAFFDQEIAVLDGTQGVTVLSDKLKIEREIPISTNFGAQSKKTVAFTEDRIIVAEGAKGAGIYNAQSGNLLEYIPILVNPDSLILGEKVTNAVAFNEGVIVMANGGAGLCLSEKKIDGSDLMGVVQLDGSTNFVESKDDYVFAASGKEGLQILKLNRPSESLANQCVSLLEYNGDSDLKVDDDENLAYSGSKNLKSVEVKGTLLLCGSWTVREDTKIREDALFQMNGTFAVGNNKRRRDIIVEKNATFMVEGNLNIYGDLILEEGATLQFLGTAVVNIFGEVDIKDPSVQIKGNFVDVQNVFP